MFNTAILDTAIGLAFVYLLMSLIASVAQELLSTFMQLRAANLQRGLQSLFSGDSLWGQDLVEMIYNHGLVRGLYRDPEVDEKKNVQTKGIDKLRVAFRTFVGVPHKLGRRSAAQTMLLPAYIPSRTFALALIDFLNWKKASGDEAMREITESLAKHHWLYRNNKAGEALLTLANDAKGNLDTFQTKLENWYNDAMDRVSGWYKRYTQRVLLYIGIILAIAFNVDSLRVARTLWVDRDVRQAMVNAAGSYVSANPAGPAIAAPAPAPDGSLHNDVQGEVNRMSVAVDAFNRMATTSLLPIGWQRSTDSLRASFRSHPWLAVGRLLEWQVPGWLLTGMAISLGAPFWFDLLNKFMVVRSTIKPEEKSLPEPSKD